MDIARRHNRPRADVKRSGEATAGVTLPFIIYGVPSPSAAAGLGLIGLVGLRRRR